MNKRGISHVEFILASILFIGFLAFAIFFFNPLNAGRVLDSSLYYASDEIKDELSVDLESYTVVIEPSVGNTVISFPVNNLNGYGLKVVDVDGTVFNSGYTSGNVNVDRIGGENDILIVMFSPDFTTGSQGSGFSLAAGEFQISSSDERKLISEFRINELKTRYDTDYDNLKVNEFNLPGRINFAFSLELDDGTIIQAEKNIPERLEVVVQQDRVEIIRNNLGNNIVFGDLTVKVW